MQQFQPRTIWIGVGVLVLVLYLALAPQKRSPRYSNDVGATGGGSSELSNRFQRLEQELAARQQGKASTKSGDVDMEAIKELLDSVKHDTDDLKREVHKDTESLDELKRGQCSCAHEVARVKAAEKAMAPYARTIEEACVLAAPDGCNKRSEKDPLHPAYVSYSQIGQDLYLKSKVFGNMSEGAFIEMGALNGMAHANTPGFETYNGWRGVCIEGNPRLAAIVEQTRPYCVDVNGVVSNLKGEVDFLYPKNGGPAALGGIKQFMASIERIKRESREMGAELVESKVKSFTLPDVLLHFGFERIDLFSLDVEGAELPVLQTLSDATDWSSWPDDPNKASPPNGLKAGEGWERLQFRVLLIENNQGSNAIHQIVTAKGYERIYNAQDAFYLKKDWPHGNKGHAYFCQASNCMGMRNRADYYEQKAAYLKKNPQH